MRMRQPSAPPLPQGEAQTAPAWDCQWRFTVTALRDDQGCAPRTASDSPGDEALCPRRASGEHGATRGAMGTGCQHHPTAASPGVPSPPPGANCVPAPSPQGFPPSQPLQPGGRESRAADGPRSPRPAESKVGTGLGARRRCARLAPELRAPSSHRQLVGWGPLAAAPPAASPPLCKVLCGGQPGVSSLLLSLTLSSLSPRGHCQGWLAPLSLSPGLPRPCKSTCQQRRGAQESHVQEVFW